MNDHSDIMKQSGGTECEITEEQFPMMLRCCIYSGVGALQRYQSICPYCKEWTLPLTMSKLEVATIFECKNRCYSKRLTE